MGTSCICDCNKNEDDITPTYHSRMQNSISPIIGCESTRDTMNSNQSKTPYSNRKFKGQKIQKNPSYLESIGNDKYKAAKLNEIGLRFTALCNNEVDKMKLIQMIVIEVEKVKQLKIDNIKIMINYSIDSLSTLSFEMIRSLCCVCQTQCKILKHIQMKEIIDIYKELTIKDYELGSKNLTLLLNEIVKESNSAYIQDIEKQLEDPLSIAYPYWYDYNILTLDKLKSLASDSLQLSDFIIEMNKHCKSIFSLQASGSRNDNLCELSFRERYYFFNDIQPLEYYDNEVELSDLESECGNEDMKKTPVVEDKISLSAIGYVDSDSIVEYNDDLGNILS